MDFMDCNEDFMAGLGIDNYSCCDEPEEIYETDIDESDFYNETIEQEQQAEESRAAAEYNEQCVQEEINNAFTEEYTVDRMTEETELDFTSSPEEQAACDDYFNGGFYEASEQEKSEQSPKGKTIIDFGTDETETAPANEGKGQAFSGFTKMQEDNACSKEKENTVSQNDTEQNCNSDVEIIEEEQDVEFSKEYDHCINDNEKILKIKKAFINIGLFAALWGFVVGLPVLAATMGHRTSIKAKAEIQRSSSVSSTLIETTTENDSYFNKVTENTDTTESSSGRFKTLDELSLYIDSNIGVVLSEDKQLYNKYQDGKVSTQKYKTKISSNKEKSSYLLKLLVANKHVYYEYGREEEYNQLQDTLNKLLVYENEISL